MRSALLRLALFDVYAAAIASLGVRFALLAMGLPWVVAACGSAQPPLPMAAPLALSNAPLAQVGTEAITAASLAPQVYERLARIDDAYAQERLVALWAGIEDAVGETLLRDEAARQRLDVPSLLAREVTQKVGRTTDAEVRALYENHRSLIDAPYDEAAPSLREHARSDRLRALRRALIDRLRAATTVQLALPTIDLHRTDVSPFGPRLGPSTAPLTLIVFSDFSCPFSAQARRLIEQLHGMYGPALSIVHRNYPLRQHEHADTLALAGICAAKQGKFWAYYERAFDHGQKPQQGLVHALATAAGLDRASLDACMVSRAAKEALARDIADGQAAGVQGTPSLFLNGMPLRGVLPLPVVESLIAQESARLNRPAAPQSKPTSATPAVAHPAAAASLP